MIVGGFVDQTDPNVLGITGYDSKGAKPCDSTSVHVQGNNHQLHLTSRCAALVVAGYDNRITVDTVGSIEVQGNGNHVAWHEGRDGGRPRVSASGYDNIVEQSRTADPGGERRPPEP